MQAQSGLTPELTRAAVLALHMRDNPKRRRVERIVSWLRPATEERYMEHEIKPGTKWAKKSNPSHVATVLWFEPGDRPGYGYLRYTAPWSQTGELGKALDSFLGHYDPLPANG